MSHSTQRYPTSLQRERMDSWTHWPIDTNVELPCASSSLDSRFASSALEAPYEWGNVACAGSESLIPSTRGDGMGPTLFEASVIGGTGQAEFRLANLPQDHMWDDMQHPAHPVSRPHYLAANLGLAMGGHGLASVDTRASVSPRADHALAGPRVGHDPDGPRDVVGSEKRDIAHDRRRRRHNAPKYRCPCGKWLSKKSGYEDHLRRHENKRKFACRRCSSRFNTKRDRQRHQSRCRA
uniref:C2H2-type domain-containing protein n=1 Tax=Schizophyllum commune (strain H4-8 / FGSC 9210) TaxID=578458 RepID=D8PYT7_SCHCM